MFQSSIFRRLCLTLLVCVIVLFGLNFLLNNFGLTGYYRQVKTDALKNAYAQVNALYESESSSVETELYRLSSNSNIRITLWNGNRIIYNFRPGGNWFFSPPFLAGSMENGTYFIDNDTDERLGTTFISLYGKLDNGYLISIQTSVAAIEESIAITNDFLIVSGLLSLLIGFLLIFWVSRSFSRPIRRLAQMADEVAHLNFSARYSQKKGKDELTLLGNSINSMSASLEQTIRELNEANESLQRDVEEKTRQSEARRAFIANVSHELKTPIALISAYAEGLRENAAEDPASQAHYLEIIEDEAQKMSELIRRMTMLMQLEGGGEELMIERCNAGELLRNLTEKNRVLFAKDDVAVAMPDPGAPQVYVWADDYLIELVLNNFLTNAFHHVEKNGRIEVVVHAQENGMVRLSVFNSGFPIAAEDLPHIWESFYKADKSHSRSYGGNGIGLSVVAAIMKAHDTPYGVLNHTEEDRRGVEFFAEFRLAPDSPEDPNSSESPDSPDDPNSPESPDSPETDDNDMNN